MSNPVYNANFYKFPVGVYVPPEWYDQSDPKKNWDEVVTVHSQQTLYNKEIEGLDQDMKLPPKNNELKPWTWKKEGDPVFVFPQITKDHYIPIIETSGFQCSERNGSDGWKQIQNSTVTWDFVAKQSSTSSLVQIVVSESTINNFDILLEYRRFVYNESQLQQNTSTTVDFELSFYGRMILKYLNGSSITQLNSLFELYIGFPYKLYNILYPIISKFISGYVVFPVYRESLTEPQGRADFKFVDSSMKSYLPNSFAYLHFKLKSQVQLTSVSENFFMSGSHEVAEGSFYTPATPATNTYWNVINASLVYKINTGSSITNDRIIMDDDNIQFTFYVYNDNSNNHYLRCYASSDITYSYTTDGSTYISETFRIFEVKITSFSVGSSYIILGNDNWYEITSSDITGYAKELNDDPSGGSISSGAEYLIGTAKFSDTVINFTVSYSTSSPISTSITMNLNGWIYDLTGATLPQ